MYAAYKQWIIRLQEILRNTKDLAIPTDDPSVYVQVVHDVMKQYYVHKTMPKTYRIDMEAVLYRKNKPFAKHVGMSVVCQFGKDAWMYDVVSVEVLGVIPEDTIGMFPVVAFDPFATNSSSLDAAPSPSVIASDEETMRLVRKQFEGQRRFATTQARLASLRDPTSAS